MFFKRLRGCCSDVFKLTKVMLQIIYGKWRLGALAAPRVTIFGGARAGEKTQYAQQAFEFSRKLVSVGIPVLTGGGAGVMRAANCGALEKGTDKVKSVGIGVRELGEGRNPCVQEYFELEYFFARKWLLTHFSIAFVVFPGGFGTMDELTEVLTLIQTQKLMRVPIILIGVSYWQYFMKWVVESAVVQGLVQKKHLELFTITDDLNEAFEIVYKECGKMQK